MNKLIVIFLFAFTGVFAQADLKKLDAYYAKALKDWNVPGMSIAIVKDGKVIFSKGYGTKEVGKSEAPDGNTLYAIASNTKAFTATAMGILVDEGKLSWNDKVTQYIPWFELPDPMATREATIRDILSHRVGLGTFSGDLIWYRSNLSDEEIIRRIKHLPVGYSFRAGYGYSNLMYITAGEVIERVSEKSWADFVKAKLFQPLAMNRTIVGTRELEQ
ncbi:MAG TPA: serine hydrolase domain-containing protein, partial [Ohtaekwangia sp.]|nr:serine hydrolase domain-containing protein [Ohtaekwangia sp.]